MWEDLSPEVIAVDLYLCLSSVCLSVCLRVCVPVSVLSAAFSLCEFVDPVIVTRVVAELVGE